MLTNTGSLGHLIQVTTELGGQGVGFRSLSESIDTETAGGRLVFHMMGASPSSNDLSSPNGHGRG